MELMHLVKSISSADRITTKFVFGTNDGYLVEAVYVNYENKHIICYSTQVGCNGGCKFCYNGIKRNFKRNLRFREIVDQCLYIYGNYIDDQMPEEPDDDDKPILFSAMGIGDPLDNYDEYIASIKHFNSVIPTSRLFTGKNKFALSTCAPNPRRIYSLIPDTELMNFKLQISLHSAFPDQRNELIPMAGNLDEIINAVTSYIVATNRDVEFNVTLMQGINDTPDHAQAIYNSFYKFYRHGVMNHVSVKINKFNQIDGCSLHESDKKTIDSFMNALNLNGIRAEYYETNGADINAACGQLALDYYDML